MKKILLLILTFFIFLPSANAIYSCNSALVVYNETGITGADTGDFIAIPNNIERYYIKIDATEVASGGVTVNLLTNESASTTDAIPHNASALTVTGVTRVKDIDTSAGYDYFGPYVYVTTSSVTGTWDIIVTLYYD